MKKVIFFPKSLKISPKESVVLDAGPINEDFVFVLSSSRASIGSEQSPLFPNKGEILPLGREKKLPPSRIANLLLSGTKTLPGKLKILIVFTCLETWKTNKERKFYQLGAGSGYLSLGMLKKQKQ